jgi:hypothetical protein
MKPEPLTPPDCDLRDFSWMPLDVIRLRDSDLAVISSGDAFRAAVLLWCASWHSLRPPCPQTSAFLQTSPGMVAT